MGLLLKLTVLEACVMPFMPKTLSAVDWYKTIYITTHCHWILSDFVAWYGLCYSQIMDPNCDFSLAGSLFPCITLWRVTTSVGYRLHWNKYWYSCQDYVRTLSLKTEGVNIQCDYFLIYSERVSHVSVLLQLPSGYIPSFGR